MGLAPCTTSPNLRSKELKIVVQLCKVSALEPRITRGEGFLPDPEHWQLLLNW